MNLIKRSYSTEENNVLALKYIFNKSGLKPKPEVLEKS